MRHNKLIVGIGLLLIGVFALYGFAAAEMTLVAEWNSDQFTFPYDVTVHTVESEDYVYVTDNSGCIRKFTSAGDLEESWSGFNSPTGITVDEVYIYVTDNSPDGSTARLHRIHKDGETAECWPITGAPYDMAVDSGSVYVANSTLDLIQKITFDGGNINIEPLWGTFLNDPSDIAFGVDGSVYVADGGSATVKKLVFDIDNEMWTSTTWQIPTPDGVLPYASGIMVDYEGNIHVVDSANGRIVKFNSNGSLDETDWYSVNQTIGFNKPRGITVDSQGYVYVADKNNDRILKFSPSCNVLVELTTLIGAVADLNTVKGIINSLDAKLQNAIESLTAVNADQRQDAVNKLESFINAVEAQRGAHLTDGEADSFIYQANSVINCLQQ